MAEVVFSPQARVDLADILDYLTEEAGASTAVKYRAQFRELTQQLSEFPESGAPRSRLCRLVRLSVVPPYVVIYRYVHATDTVVVARILHGSRRITPRLLRTK